MIDYRAMVVATGNDPDEVIAEVRAGKAHTWHTDRAIMVTRFDQEPEGKSIHVWIGAGDLQDLLALQPLAEDFGRERGCVVATIEGRRGWVRALRERGFKRVADGATVTLRKVL